MTTFFEGAVTIILAIQTLQLVQVKNLIAKLIPILKTNTEINKKLLDDK